MPDCPHRLLIDLLAAQDSAAGYGCGLDPRLLELLIERHAARAGVHRLDLPIRAEGPAQAAPADLPRRGAAAIRPFEAGHARR